MEEKTDKIKMKLTPKRKKDLETIKFFMPNLYSKINITKEDIKQFFELSERGLHKEKRNERIINGFNALISGKRWRGICMQMWEEGILEGSIPYWTLLGGEDKSKILPGAVVEFMAKEMFKGVDQEIIKDLYKEIKQNENK